MYHPWLEDLRRPPDRGVGGGEEGCWGTERAAAHSLNRALRDINLIRNHSYSLIRNHGNLIEFEYKELLLPVHPRKGALRDIHLIRNRSNSF